MDNSKGETKYERLRKIGIGSYGVVFKCVNRQTGQIVAIKRYSENDTDPMIRKIAMREVRMLRQLKHPNLIHLIEVFRRKRILHLVFDYCELTVLDVIEKYANNCPLNLIRKIIWQLVNGVSHCHSHNCIHRDIKPENILINQSGVVKLCDFGFARNLNVSARSIAAAASSSMSAKQVKYEREAQLLGVSTYQMSQFMMTTGNASNKPDQQQQQRLFENNQENQQSERLALTEYVATRWYRAPELLVGDVYYDKKIDIWAIGCVTAELMRGEPVWPGKTDLDQLFMIKNSLGSLTAGQTHTLLTQELYDQASVEQLMNQTNVSDPLERKLPHRVGPAGLEFVFHCLCMDPARRPTCEELLQHHYIQSAQMSLFVRGADHSATTLSTGEHSSLGPRGSNLKSRHLAAESLGTRGQTSNANRSNSQALRLMANNQQQSARKGLLVASGASSNYQSPKPSSLVPVLIRSRQPDDNPTQGDGLMQQQQQQQQHLEQQRKRSLPHLTGNRSIATGQQTKGRTQKAQTTKVEGKPAPAATHRGSIGSKSPGPRQWQSNGNLSSGGNPATPQRRAMPGGPVNAVVHQTGNNGGRNARFVDGLTDHLDVQRQRLVKPIETARRDRQQTNLGHHSHQTGGTASRQLAPNSSASSSSPTSFSTNKSSSTSFLPPVQH